MLDVSCLVARVEAIGIDVLAVSGHGERRCHVLLPIACARNIENHRLVGIVVRDVYFLDLNIAVRLAVVKSACHQ